MKKFFAILLALTVVPTFHSYAWVGGPFDNNNFSPDGDDGIYEAIAIPTGTAGVGLYRWGVNNRNTGGIDFNNGQQGNTSNVQFGGFVGAYNQHVLYINGQTYYGNCIGTANSSLNVVSCTGTAAVQTVNIQDPASTGSPLVTAVGNGGTVLIPTDTDGDPTTTEFIPAVAVGNTAYSFFTGGFRKSHVPWADSSRNFQANGEINISLADATAPPLAPIPIIVFGSRVSLLVTG